MKLAEGDCLNLSRPSLALTGFTALLWRGDFLFESFLFGKNVNAGIIQSCKRIGWVLARNVANRKAQTQAALVAGPIGASGSTKKRTHNREHRSDNFNESVFKDILYRMMNGEAVTTICLDPLMPDYSVFSNWISSTPERYQEYARARQIQTDYYVDDVINIADTEFDSNRARNRIAARQWHASKIAPRKYGDRLTQEITQTVTTKFSLDLSVLDGDARAKLRESILNSMKTGKTIDGDYEVEG